MMNKKFFSTAIAAMICFSNPAFSAKDETAHLRGAATHKPAKLITATAAEERTANAGAVRAETDGKATENADADKAETLLPYIGDTETIRSEYEDTLLQLAREYNIGYVEIVAANPGVDPWLPGDGRKITLPKRHIIPNTPREGIVINLAEMRLYSFLDGPDKVKTYPIGIGRDGLNTPIGTTKIVRKKEGPTWTPTERMRRENPELPAFVPPGEDNPLGTHAMYLGWPQYLIHGTHKPLGVGRRVSSGCIRMYPEDIITVFNNVPVGTPVRVIKEPVKLAWIDGMLYLEAHAEDELADSYEEFGKIKKYEVPPTLFSDLEKAAGDKKGQLDWYAIRAALKQRSGMPVPILLDDDEEPVETEVTEDILDIEPVLPEPEPQAVSADYQFNS